MLWERLLCSLSLNLNQYSFLGGISSSSIIVGDIREYDSKSVVKVQRVVPQKRTENENFFNTATRNNFQRVEK